MGAESSAGDLLAICKLKNTDVPAHFHNDHYNLPSAAQISVEPKIISCGKSANNTGAKLVKTCFFVALNNAENTSKLTTTK